MSRSDGEKDRLKVLMIGNSFSICALRYLPEVALDRGRKLDLASLYIGGCSLERHWNNAKDDVPGYNAAGYGEGVTLKQMLEADKWDIVTMQQASHFSWRNLTFYPYFDNLVAFVREHAPQAEIVIQQTWSYSPYDSRLARWQMSPKEMYEALKKAYAQLAAKHGLRIIPTADAVQLFRDRLPVDYGKPLTRAEIAAIKKPATVDFHGDVVGASEWKQGRRNKQKDWEKVKLRCDFSHFNARGHYLQACVWLGFLFNVDPVTFAYRPENLDEADAKLMRACARDALASSRSR
jgi:hypothetical protein